MVFEHLTPADAVRFLKECFRCLQPGGVLRLCVPCIENIIRRADPDYLRFVSQFGVQESIPGAIDAIVCGHGHQSIWTQELLVLMTEVYGFRCTVCQPRQSEFEELRDIDGHWKAIGERNNAVETTVVECRKPPFIDRECSDDRGVKVTAMSNGAGVTLFPPGHYHSPLLDIESIGTGDSGLPHDGPEFWEFVDLRTSEQRAYYGHLFQEYPMLSFPPEAKPGFRYYQNNGSFPLSDALTLSAVIQHELPNRIIEIGAGFSSAVMLDTVDHVQRAVEMTFVEPSPERLLSRLSASDKSVCSVFPHPVQEVPISLFEALEEHDILFVDSSHVAKIGSDVVLLLLRILPRLRAGVLVHFHDIFYPMSYPAVWIREGRAWNESLFLRAFLIANPMYEIVAFNSYAGATFPDMFGGAESAFRENAGGSLWLRKMQ